MTIPLFRRFPSLDGGIPHVALVRRPTPVQSFEIAGAGMWVKRDDLSGGPYGGNKVRKLEFWRRLPGDCRAYFMGPVQELDR